MMIDHALTYARRGWAVFPVAPGKAPLCAHGVHSATTEHGQISAWWQRHPDANVAVRCSLFWVLDIDPRNGGDETLLEWLDIHGPLPHTWTARTGGGGVHYYFVHDTRLDELPLGPLARGIDIKGGGRHYVLVPPSVSKSGAYRWLVPPSHVLAPAPEWLLRLVVRTKRPKIAEAAPFSPSSSEDRRFERAIRYARQLDPAVSGQGGQQALWRAAVKLTRGFDLSPSEAYAILAREWNLQCSPPWSAPDLHRAVHRARDLGRMPIGALLERTRP
jgi:hypothetical protein